MKLLFSIIGQKELIENKAGSLAKTLSVSVH